MIKRWIGLVATLMALPAVASNADVIVSAASSLQNAFVEIGKEFEATNLGVKVLFNFGASGQLVQQIARGAPAHVLATADLATMDKASKQNLIVPDTRSNFVSNALVLVVPFEAAGPVPALDRLNAATVKHIALGTPESVPAGLYAKEALELAGQWEALKDKYVYGQNVRQVLDYVARGEVDAGFVYATDAVLMKDKVKTAGPIRTRTPILYPIAAVKSSGNESGARRFIQVVKSDVGRSILTKYGFAPP